MRVYTCEPGTEVSGEVLLGVINNIRSDQFMPYLEVKGLTDVQPHHWYPLEKLMDIFNEMTKRGGDSSNFVALGMAIATYSVMPEGAESPTMVQMLEVWNDHYQINHRSGKISQVQTVKVHDKHYQLVLEVAHTYPHDLVYGLAYGFCRKLLPSGTTFTVRYDDEYKPSNPNADKIILHVEWA